MRIISFIILFLLISINAYAENYGGKNTLEITDDGMKKIQEYNVIPIYCPECKVHIYDYQKEEIIPNTLVLAKDFTPTPENPHQPQESEKMNCPLCDSPLNGWEYIGRKYKSFVNMCVGISMLTKDDLGFKWIPYDVPGTEYTREK